VVVACARCGTTEAAAAARGAPAALACKKCKHEVGAAFRPVRARAHRPRSCALRPNTRKRGLRDRGEGGGSQDVLHAHNPSAGFLDLTNCKALSPAPASAPRANASLPRRPHMHRAAGRARAESARATNAGHTGRARATLHSEHL